MEDDWFPYYPTGATTPVAPERQLIDKMPDWKVDIITEAESTADKLVKLKAYIESREHRMRGQEAQQLTVAKYTALDTYYNVLLRQMAQFNTEKQV